MKQVDNVRQMVSNWLMNTTNRNLVAIDLENLMGGADPSPTLLDCAVELVESFRHDGNLVVVAASHRVAALAAWKLPWVRWRWRSGPDGADLALLEVLQNERVEQRFDRLTLVSGDGIFSGTIAALAHLGVHTTVVAAPDRLSKRLRVAAHTIDIVDITLEQFHDAA